MEVIMNPWNLWLEYWLGVFTPSYPKTPRVVYRKENILYVRFGR